LSEIFTLPEVYLVVVNENKPFHRDANRCNPNRHQIVISRSVLIFFIDVFFILIQFHDWISKFPVNFSAAILDFICKASFKIIMLPALLFIRPSVHFWEGCTVQMRLMAFDD
jgi:hypothetical protein